MSTDAGSAAAPEDAATREVASERPGLESGDPESADSATSTPETADRGGSDSGDADSDSDSSSDSDSDSVSGDADADAAGPGSNPADEGFVASLLRDATITGLPRDTGAPPAEQEGDESVGSEPRTGDDPDGVD